MWKHIAEAKKLLSSDDMIDFKDVLTEYRFKKKLMKLDLYREPSRFDVSNEAVEVNPGEFQAIQHQGVLMDIEFQIRKFLEIEGVLNTILEYQEQLSQLDQHTYENFINGSYWKSIVQKYPGKVLVPIFFYNDDFQIDNQKGPHSGVHALSPFYYIFPTLPPHLSSKLNFIFSVIVVQAEDMKMFGNDSPLYVLLNIFKKIENDGIILFKDTPSEKRIHIVACKVLGDNLGLHTICGYRRTFTINRPCITCEIQLDDLRYTIIENANILRTSDKYEAYFEDGNFFEYGVEKRCILNELPSFHVTRNNIFDLMHDVKLGVVKFRLQEALRYFIRSFPEFNLHALNQRIQSFDYGRKERGNKPPRILEAHIKNKLQMNANESWFFIRHFPLLVINLIPYDDPVYQFLLETIDIVELIYKSKFSEEDVHTLQNMISRNLDKFCDLFGTYLKPKDHNLTHYGSAIRLWSIEESFNYLPGRKALKTPNVH